MAQVQEPPDQSLDVQGQEMDGPGHAEGGVTLLPPPSGSVQPLVGRVMPTHIERIIFSKTSSQTHSKIIFSQLFGHPSQADT